MLGGSRRGPFVRLFAGIHAVACIMMMMMIIIIIIIIMIIMMIMILMMTTTFAMNVIIVISSPQWPLRCGPPVEQQPRDSITALPAISYITTFPRSSSQASDFLCVSFHGSRDLRAA